MSSWYLSAETLPVSIVPRIFKAILKSCGWGVFSYYGKMALVYGRTLRPDAELSFRPVPDSPKYTATAVGHHEGFSGSLVLLDPGIVDDGEMAQLKRITPEYYFPEVEAGATHTYGTAWPLSEDFYLCNYNSGLYLLDRFGNRDVIYDPGPGAHRVRDPFPWRAADWLQPFWRV